MIGIDPAGPVSEADPDFENKASRAHVEAVRRAELSGGVVPKSADWERTASAAAREERRQETLRREKKVDEELDKDLNGEVRAKYKIEITFGYKRTMKTANTVGIQIWESGKRFHGGGDDLMFWCIDGREGHNEGCGAPITSDYIKGGVAYCQSCKRAVNSEFLTNMLIGNVTMDTLAKRLEKIFRSLGSNADLYIKYHKTDIHYIAMEKAQGPEKAAQLKGMHIYPLKSILRDTAAGADIVKRFHAFITS
jgi:hypothetical protein